MLTAVILLSIVLVVAIITIFSLLSDRNNQRRTIEQLKRDIARQERHIKNYLQGSIGKSGDADARTTTYGRGSKSSSQSVRRSNDSSGSNKGTSNTSDNVLLMTAASSDYSPVRSYDPGHSSGSYTPSSSSCGGGGGSSDSSSSSSSCD